jgi:putative hydrolase of the HAD superfamily
MIELLAFDGDDTLWHSEGYYQAAHDELERLLSRWVEIGDARVHERLLEIERGNLRLFGYGAKGMTLSMVEAAIAITDGRIDAAGIHRIVELGKAVLEHPVELLPGIRAAVEAVAREVRVALVTKGDLFHQEAKVAACGLGDLFHRIEIVSEKDTATYRRLLGEFGVAPARFAMVGNSLRSDIEPVVALGGWGIYMPYHVTWAHERDAGIGEDHARVETVAGPEGIPDALRRLQALARGE